MQNFVTDPPHTMPSELHAHCRASEGLQKEAESVLQALAAASMHTIASVLSLWMQTASEAFSNNSNSTGAGSTSSTEPVLVPTLRRCGACNAMGTALLRCSRCHTTFFCDRLVFLPSCQPCLPCPLSFLFPFYDTSLTWLALHASQGLCGCRKCQAAAWQAHKQVCVASGKPAVDDGATTAALHLPSNTLRRAQCAALSALQPIGQMPGVWQHLAAVRPTILSSVLHVFAALGLSSFVSTPWAELAEAYMPDGSESEGSEDGDADKALARSAAATAAASGAAVLLAADVSLASVPHAPTLHERCHLLRREWAASASAASALGCLAAAPLQQSANSERRTCGTRNAFRLAPLCVAALSASAKAAQPGPEPLAAEVLSFARAAFSSALLSSEEAIRTDAVAPLQVCCTAHQT